MAQRLPRHHHQRSDTISEPLRASIGIEGPHFNARERIPAGKKHSEETVPTDLPTKSGANSHYTDTMTISYRAIQGQSLFQVCSMSSTF